MSCSCLPCKETRRLYLELNAGTITLEQHVKLVANIRRCDYETCSMCGIGSANDTSFGWCTKCAGEWDR